MSSIAAPTQQAVRSSGGTARCSPAAAGRAGLSNLAKYRLVPTVKWRSNDLEPGLRIFVTGL